MGKRKVSLAGASSKTLREIKDRSWEIATTPIENLTPLDLHEDIVLCILLKERIWINKADRGFAEAIKRTTKRWPDIVVK